METPAVPTIGAPVDGEGEVVDVGILAWEPGVLDVGAVLVDGGGPSAVQDEQAAHPKPVTHGHIHIHDGDVR